jgi:hypothetical protein
MGVPRQTDPQFKLRMTPDIKEAIERAADENNRSMNAEIISRLQDSLFGSSKATIDDVAQIAWNAINHGPSIPSAEKMQELEILYLSIKEREAEDRKKFIQMVREVVDTHVSKKS